MKSVLVSIRPKWCEKILSGEKTIEVRKSAQKEVPFKAYIYQTKSKDNAIYKRYKVDDLRGGKVIGEFVCDKVYKWNYDYCDGVDIDDDLIVETCIDREEINIYAKGKTLYGWHISDLKIYDKSKYLNEITPFCKYKGERCECCPHYVEAFGGCCKTLKRPPQNYMFIDEL